MACCAAPLARDPQRIHIPAPSRPVHIRNPHPDSVFGDAFKSESRCAFRPAKKRRQSALDSGMGEAGRAKGERGTVASSRRCAKALARRQISCRISLRGYCIVLHCTALYCTVVRRESWTPTPTPAPPRSSVAKMALATSSFFGNGGRRPLSANKYSTVLDLFTSSVENHGVGESYYE